MPADALTTLGARASAGMVILTVESQNILYPPSEELIDLINSFTIEEGTQKSNASQAGPLTWWQLKFHQLKGSANKLFLYKSL